MFKSRYDTLIGFGRSHGQKSSVLKGVVQDWKAHTVAHGVAWTEQAIRMNQHNRVASPSASSREGSTTPQVFLQPISARKQQ
jgi:hypothetical protein